MRKEADAAEVIYQGHLVAILLFQQEHALATLDIAKHPQILAWIINSIIIIAEAHALHAQAMNSAIWEHAIKKIPNPNTKGIVEA